MKRHAHFTQLAILASLLFVVMNLMGGGKVFAQTQERAKTEVKGLIPFDFPNAPETKIEVNLSGKLISLVAKAAKQKPEVAELIEMLDGVYVRVYEGESVNLEQMIGHYKSKLKKDDWEVIAKVKEKNETIEVRMLLNDEAVLGIFVMVAEPKETILVNIVGKIDPERIGEVLGSLGGLNLVPQLKDLDIKTKKSQRKKQNKSD